MPKPKVANKMARVRAKRESGLFLDREIEHEQRKQALRTQTSIFQENNNPNDLVFSPDHGNKEFGSGQKSFDDVFLNSTAKRRKSNDGNI